MLIIKNNTYNKSPKVTLTLQIIARYEQNCQNYCYIKNNNNFSNQATSKLGGSTLKISDYYPYLLIMYNNLNADRNWTNLIKIGEAGPINWQEGVMCFIVGWQRFTNSTWDKKYQGYRRQVEQKIDQLRISLDFPKLINTFLTHLLISLLISTIIFIAACFMPDSWEILKPIGFGQLMVWNIVYLVWSLVLVKVMRARIRKGFKDIQSVMPELRLQFSMFCDCWCECINQNYITIYLKE